MGARCAIPCRIERLAMSGRFSFVAHALKFSLRRMTNDVGLTNLRWLRDHHSVSCAPLPWQETDCVSSAPVWTSGGYIAETLRTLNSLSLRDFQA